VKLEMNHSETMPLARTEQLIVQELPDETLVYDSVTHKAHCLNKTAAAIWRHCDGRSTVAEAADALHELHGLPRDERIVEFTLQQFAKAKLLDAPAVGRAAEKKMSRRELAKHVGVTVGAAAVLLPLISSIVAPTAYAAASLLPKGSPCSSGLQCQSGICKGGKCL
jgi:hypothetical protein